MSIITSDSRGVRRSNPTSGRLTGDLDLDGARQVAQLDVGLGAGAGVLEGVGECFLHDPEAGEVDSRRQRLGISDRAEPDGQPRGRQPLDQVWKLGDTGVVGRAGTSHHRTPPGAGRASA
jgi:hypothetical protein